MCRMICAMGRVDATAVVEAASRMSCGVSPHHEHGTVLRPDGSASLRHLDGWGALYRDGGGTLVCTRGTEAIGRDPRAMALTAVETDFLVIHVRNATLPTQRGLAYTHPVRAEAGEEPLWFFHNGYAPDVYRLLGRDRPGWDTRDLFDWLVQGYGVDEWERELATRLATLPESTTSANFILTSGERVVVGNWYPAASPAPRYYRMHRFETGETVVIASEPCEHVAPAERWATLANGTVWSTPFPSR